MLLYALVGYIRIVALIFTLIMVGVFLLEFSAFIGQKAIEKIIDGIIYSWQKETSSLKTKAEASFDFSARRYGIGYDIQEIECIIDHSGAARVQRLLTILAYSQIGSFDTYLLVPESSSQDQERVVGFLRAKSLSEDREVIKTKQKKEFQKSSVELTFSSELKINEECRVQVVEQLPQGLFAVNLNRQQLSQRKTPYDYFGWNINRPTRNLKVQVFMPEAYMPDIYGVEVRYASASGLPAEKIQMEEQKRVQNPKRTVEAGRCILTLEVDYPMIGLIYIIKWEPKPLGE